MSVDPVEYRRVVGRFTTGVTVVTTVADGVHHAMTANSFTSVSLDPVLVLFCPEKDARLHDAVLTSGFWGVSVLATGQEQMSKWFATRGRPVAGQFDPYPHSFGPQTGVVLFSGTLATLECRTVTVVDAGDHSVVIGEVVGLDLPHPEADPLLFYEGQYRSFPGSHGIAV